MVNSRSKGQRGEREVVAMLQPTIDRVYEAAGREPPQLERNLMQSRAGGYDIVGIEWLALEVKRVEVEWSNSWWEQAKRQARPGQLPVLLYRMNRRKWSVRIHGYLHVGTSEAVKVDADVDVEAFLVWFEKMLKLHLR